MSTRDLAEPINRKKCVSDLLEHLKTAIEWDDVHGALDGITSLYWAIKELVEQLQSTYPTSNQLPPNGQELWRNLQGSVREITPDNQVAFFKALDPFHRWLVSHYEAAQATDTGTEQASLGGQGGADRPAHTNRVTKADLFAFLATHHRSSDGTWAGAPLTQQQLAGKLGCSQSTVSRLFKELFDNGVDAYHEACSRGKPPTGFRKHSEGGDSVDGICDEASEDE